MLVEAPETGTNGNVIRTTSTTAVAIVLLFAFMMRLSPVVVGSHLLGPTEKQLSPCSYEGGVTAE